jgi:hypothetical protein
MTKTQPISASLGRKRLAILTVGALGAGGLIVLGAILPAEFNKDYLGVGKLTGLSRLWAPDEVDIDPNAGGVARAHNYPIGYRSDVIEIPLTGINAGSEGFSLEYKVKTAKDATFIYEWEVIGATDPSDMEFDFHGHTVPRSPDEKMVVSSYEKANGIRRAGSLVAPFDGIHGWYFQSWQGEPVIVRIKISGFYDLIPSGAPGNEAGIVANVPATQARPNPTLRSEALASANAKGK